MKTKTLGVVGSLASIIGVLWLFLPATPTNSQNSTGDHHVFIQQDDGTVYINQAKEKKPVLVNTSAGSTLVTSESGLGAARDAAKHVCLAVAGTEIALLPETAEQFGMAWWQKIAITSGECAGKTGWVAKDNIVFQ